MNEFDDLFNQFFGNKKKMSNKKKPTNEGIDYIMKLMDKLNDGSINNPTEESLGEADSVRIFERDGVTFEESTWETEFGSIVRITTKEDTDFTPDFFKKNNIPLGKPIEMNIPSVEERLKIAISNENYEEAARLRDIIEEKSKKNKPTENLDTKGLTDKDEWNF